MHRPHVLISLVALAFAASFAAAGCGDNTSASSNKTIQSFAFLVANNPALAADVTGTISGTQIAADVPHGTGVVALVATFTTADGTSVTVGGVPQASGVTANDFTSPIDYKVTAADSSTVDYLVTITPAASADKAITAYSFAAANNRNLPSDIVGIVNGTSISATVPFGTDATALIATFSTTGTEVVVDATPQHSGATANDFTSPVVYIVTAQDGTTRDYTVTVQIAPNTAKAITSYSFAAANNGVLATDEIGSISAMAISVTVPFGTDVHALRASFAITGAAVTVGGTAQVSGATPNDFSSDVTYLVTAADASTATYTVHVTIAQNTAKAITSFQFLTSANPVGLPTNVSATIDEDAHTIAAVVPYGTAVGSLVATFVTTGSSVDVGAAVPTLQVSGTTPNDFSSPVTYTVSAADASTQGYVVTVRVEPAILTYAFTVADNAQLTAPVTGTIDTVAHTVALTVPFATDLTAPLTASFTISSGTIAVGATAQLTDVTPEVFSSPVVYTLTAPDTTTVAYTVTVSRGAPATTKDLTAFAFTMAENAGLTADAVGTIDPTAHIVTVTVPFTRSLSGLIASFADTGTSLEIGTAVQDTGVTPNDFGAAVLYTVVAQDSSVQDYTVEVGNAGGFSSFVFPAALNPSLGGVDVTGAIDNTAHTIALIIPDGATLGALTATFAANGAVTIGGAPQTSGGTINSFSTALTYHVDTGTDAEDYVVTVAQSVGFTTFGFDGFANYPTLESNYDGTIDNATHEVDITVPAGTPLTSLVPFFTSDAHSVLVGATVQQSDDDVHDFSAAVTYTLVPASGPSIDYTVTVHEPPGFSAFTFTAAANPTALATDGFSSINGGVITVAVPAGTPLLSLAATFTTTATSVVVGTTTQTSGETQDDFTSAVTYSLTGADGLTSTYTVTVQNALYATASLGGTKALVFVFAPAGTSLDSDADYAAYCASQGFTQNQNSNTSSLYSSAGDFDATNYYCSSACCYLGNAQGDLQFENLHGYSNHGLPINGALEVFDRGCGDFGGSYVTGLDTTGVTLRLSAGGLGASFTPTGNPGVSKSTTFATDGVALCQAN